MKRWQIVLLSLVALIIIILLLLPGIARRTFISNSEDWIGRKTDIGKVSINYFTSTIQLTDLCYFEANEKDTFVKFDTLIVDAELWQLIRSRIVVEGLYLSGLEVNIIQYDTLFNFSDLIDHFSPGESSADKESDTGSSGFQFELADMELARGRINYHDAVVNEGTSVQDLDLYVPYLGWREEEDRASGLKFSFKNGGFIHLDADWEKAARDLHASIEIDRLELGNFSGYLKRFVNLGSLGGLLNAEIMLRRPETNLDSLDISGYLGLQEVIATTDNGDTLAGFDRLDVALHHMKPIMLSFQVDSLIIDNPYLNYIQYDSIHSNVSMFMATGLAADTVEVPDSTEKKDAPESVSWDFHIGRFAFKNGRVHFADSSLEKPFDYRLTRVVIDAEDIDSGNDRVVIRSSATLNERGKMNAELSIDPKNPLELDLYYVITDFQLSDIDPYSDQYAGLPILYGNTYYKSETTIRSGMMDSKNELIIEGAEFGDQKAGITDLPIGLAMFLMKDKNGDITIDIPVKGDVNDPGFSLRKIIYKSFSDLIGKIIASPFKILGRTFNIDPKDIKDIRYDYLDAELTKKKKKQVEALVNLEQKKKDLGIELVYFNDVNQEKEAIAMDMVGRKFNTRKRDYRKDKEEFADYVRKKVKNDTLDVGAACLLLVDPAKVDSAVNDLKNERFNTLRDYLFSLEDSTQIKLYVPDADAPKNIGSKPVLEIKYSIKAKKKAEEDLKKLGDPDTTK